MKNIFKKIIIFSLILPLFFNGIVNANTLGEYNGAGSGTTKLLLHLNGNSTDTSGNSNNGTDTSVTYSQANGKFGQGAGFNGTSSHINTSSVVLTVTDNWTLSAWINPATLPQASIAVQNGTDNGGASGNNGYGFGIADGSGASGSKLQGLLSGVAWVDSGYTFPSTSTWYHIVMVRTSGTINFYVNGTVTSGSNNTAPATPTTLSQVGSQVGIRFFNGAVDEVIMENVAWTPQQVQKYYTYTKGRFRL